jgi:ribosome-associated protein YbcJ (S4-like RNA binding protein)
MLIYDENSYIKLDDILKIINKLFNGLSIKELKEFIKNNDKYKKFYKERKKINNIDYRNVLMNFKIKLLTDDEFKIQYDMLIYDENSYIKLDDILKIINEKFNGLSIKELKGYFKHNERYSSYYIDKTKINNVNYKNILMGYKLLVNDDYKIKYDILLNFKIKTNDEV